MGRRRRKVFALPIGIDLVPLLLALFPFALRRIQSYDDTSSPVPFTVRPLHARLTSFGQCAGTVMEQLDLSPVSAFGATMLRFILAGFWIVHWWFKVGYRGMTATEAFFGQQGLPVWLAWFVVSFEVVIAICLILGVYVTFVCLISLPILFASMWIYRTNGFYFSGGGIELPTFWVGAQMAQALLGPGAFRIALPTWMP